ncbi:hypothetical protein FQV39_31555 (plasmid) [Bosea sp. F3-2]|uniref:hypothetical protein n=1 Tax=Bosea sp. F3-2 TaxID=2599640 RepID=UPI0011EE39B3|nr:hypothetical protein [Bosea sp. F3-2]QEL27136.1 hypothetical protein FQV39_31555 [Bosea sp. F3-2]
MSEPDRRAVDDAVTALRDAAKGEDIAAIETKANALQQASMKLAEAMQASSQAGPDAGSGAARADGDGIVDAEFTEIGDDDKKNKKKKG